MRLIGFVIVIIFCIVSTAVAGDGLISDNSLYDVKALNNFAKAATMP